MTRKIALDQVRHIGRLARIDLTDEQAERFSRQLGAILDYFDKLQAVDTQQVRPLVHPVEMADVMAEDRAEPSLAPDQALANAPARDGDFFRVPKVIGDSQ
jgi:aspartyl-tRNA(Asn)/glutamyl-tRNA(Gln) amidotransferase subunit C